VPNDSFKNPPHKGASRFNIEGADTVVNGHTVAAQIQARSDQRVRLVRPKLVVENELFEVHEPGVREVLSERDAF
jgi:hypothetical protein